MTLWTPTVVEGEEIKQSLDLLTKELSVVSQEQKNILCVGWGGKSSAYPKYGKG